MYRLVPGELQIPRFARDDNTLSWTLNTFSWTSISSDQ